MEANYGLSVDLLFVRQLFQFDNKLLVLSRERWSTSIDCQLTNDSSVSLVDGPTDFKSSVVNDDQPVQNVI